MHQMMATVVDAMRHNDILRSETSPPAARIPAILRLAADSQLFE